MPTDTVQNNPKKRMTKAERDALVARTLAIVQMIGVRPAAREVGQNEKTVWTWLHRARKNGANIKLPEISMNGKYPVALPDDPTGQAALERTFKYMSDKSRMALATAGMSAADQFNAMQPQALVDRDTAQALESTSRTLDRTHGWSQERAKAPVINIANIQAPTAADMAGNKATDERLDRITALLQGHNHTQSSDQSSGNG